MKHKDTDFSKLRFVRIFDPIHIPIELVDQVRDRRYSVENFYEYQNLVCLMKTPDGFALNPLNLLYVIVDDKNLVKGFLWAVVSPLSRDLVINTFSMGKEYWGKGEAVALVEKQIKEILANVDLNRVFWITNYPKHSERYGFKRSKGVLMEYKQEEEDGGNIFRIGAKTDRASQPSDSGSAKILEFDSEIESGSGQ